VPGRGARAVGDQPPEPIVEVRERFVVGRRGILVAGTQPLEQPGRGGLSLTHIFLLHLVAHEQILQSLVTSP